MNTTNKAPLVFKKIIIIFWALWWLIALWTDIVGLLSHNNWLQASWAPDTNYPFLVESMKMYDLPQWVPQLCFAGIILWSLVSTLAFCQTCLKLNRPFRIWLSYADMAFMISLSFWLAFFLADQLVMKFDLEENHMVQGGFSLLSYLAIYILPPEE